jgi:hypothetical protein
MDEPGRVPDEGSRQCARRVQPDRARLQSAAGAQHLRRRDHDGGRKSMKRGQYEVHARPEILRGRPGVTTGDLLDQNAQNVPRRASHNRYCSSANCFHTVCKVQNCGRAVGAIIKDTRGAVVVAQGGHEPTPVPETPPQLIEIAAL